MLNKAATIKIHYTRVSGLAAVPISLTIDPKYQQFFWFRHDDLELMVTFRYTTYFSATITVFCIFAILTNFNSRNCSYELIFEGYK